MNWNKEIVALAYDDTKSEARLEEAYSFGENKYYRVLIDTVSGWLPFLFDRNGKVIQGVSNNPNPIQNIAWRIENKLKYVTAYWPDNRTEKVEDTGDLISRLERMLRESTHNHLKVVYGDGSSLELRLDITVKS